MQSIVDRAFAAFAADSNARPPLSLRGANDVDSYKAATPFDAEQDEPTDEYLEGYAFWGLPHLDAQSWRHYLPRLMDYALRHPDDPRMVVEGLIYSLRPPDRYPPRLGSLISEQEAVIASFLERIAFDDVWEGLNGQARQALEEWWLSNPTSRPTAQEIEAQRNVPVTYRIVGEGIYRLEMPVGLTGSGVRDIPEESRRVETWGGYLCGDAHTVVAVNVTPLHVRSLGDSVAHRRQLFQEPPTTSTATVPGARAAYVMEGLGRGASPAEPHALTILIATTGDEAVTLTVNTWPRDDLARAAKRIVGSLRIVEA